MQRRQIIRYALLITIVALLAMTAGSPLEIIVLGLLLLIDASVFHLYGTREAAYLFGVSALFFVLYSSVSLSLILISFILANFLVAYGKRKLPFSVRKYLFGIEIVLFCTVLTSFTLGPAYGSVMGVLLMTSNYIAERRFSKYFAYTLVLYACIGYAAWFFRSMGIIRVGTASVLIYNALVFPMSLATGANKKTLSVFSMVNIIFNIVLFAGYGPLMVIILQ